MIGNLGKGLQFEERARRFLAQKGLSCLQQNFHCRWGEIDLIMRDGDTLCFIEVKYRKSLAFGGAAHALPRSKQRKIVKTAMVFLATHPAQNDQPIRFDALLIQRQKDGGDDFNWIKNAFYADA